MTATSRGTSSSAAAVPPTPPRSACWPQLDSARPLTGLTVVAEEGGRLVAAVSLHDGRVVADPFMPTADVVEMLRLHTAGGRSAKARPRRGLPRLMPRPVMPKIA